MPGIQFVSPGAAATSELRDYMIRQEAQRRQNMLDQITQDREKRLAEKDAADIANERENTASLADQRATATAQNIASNLMPGAVVDPDAAEALRRGHMAGLLKAEQNQTLPSANIETAAAAPTLTPKAGADTTSGTIEADVHPAENIGPTGRTLFAGTQKQQKDEQARQAVQAMSKDPALANHPGAKALFDYAAASGDFAGVAPAIAKLFEEQTGHEYVLGRDGKTLTDLGTLPKGSHVNMQPAPTQPPVFVIDGVDENGNPVKRVVPKVAGATYDSPKGLSGAMGNRYSSAKTVVAVGNDLIQKLSDPNYAAQLGPVLGRYHTLEDFIGTPPPEYSELAGELHSLALANMGVHGMRSAEGARDTENMMGKQHTPQSLAGFIKGLNTFAQSYVDQNGPKTPTKPGSGAGPAAATDADARKAALRKKYGL